MAQRSGTRRKSRRATSATTPAPATSAPPLALAGSALAVALAGLLAGLGVPLPWVLTGLALAPWGFIGARTLLGARKASAGLGKYTLHEKLGEGGMGVVFRATHAELGRPAALKLLAPGHETPENVERFEREAELTSRLSHPNTVAVYDFGRTAAGTPFYAMEYLEGLDLETLVERHGPQDPRRVAYLLAQMAGALSEAHGVGLIHRDVKPANVMLCERGGASDVVKVVDFGLIKELGVPGERSDDDRGRLVGTPLYLSPESILTPELQDARSDLYALGAVGYFLLTGAPPFAGASVAEVCAHHLYATPRRIPGAPSELESLILGCLAKSPGERPASAAALRTDLLELASTWTEADADAWWAEHGAEPSVRRRAVERLTKLGASERGTVGSHDDSAVRRPASERRDYLHLSPRIAADEGLRAGSPER